MFISETVKIFFRKHKDIIQSGNFTELYRIINNEYTHDQLSQTDRTLINEMLYLSNGIMVFLNLGFIPESFLFHSKNVENINVPEGIKELPYQFAYKSDIRSINLPSSLIKIGESAFFNCRLLKDIYYCGSTKEWNEKVYPHWDAFYWCNEITVHTTDGNIIISSEGR